MTPLIPAQPPASYLYLPGAVQEFAHGYFAWLKHRPMCGLNQAEYGPDSPVGFLLVKRTTSIDDELWTARMILAANLRRALRDAYPDASNRPAEFRKRTRCDVGLSVIKRLLKPQNANDPYPKLDTLVRLARALGISVYELVIDARDMRGLSNNGPEDGGELVAKGRDLKRG